MRRTLPTHFWHTTPLHYAPLLLQTGILYAQDQLRARQLPISPRRTVERRDRKLSLSKYVHLSFVPQTPLLTDKLQKGYPHILLAFGREIADLPSAAYLKYNPKRWAHRDDFLPVAHPEARAEFLQEWEAGRYPSAELLIADQLPLRPHCISLFCRTEREREWLANLCATLEIAPKLVTLPLVTQPDIFPTATEIEDFAPYTRYAADCIATGNILPPLNLPFD